MNDYPNKYQDRLIRIRNWRTLLHRRRAETSCSLTRWQHFLREMTSWSPSSHYDVKSKIRLRQSMRIYWKNNPAKFHPDPIWNDGALGFLKIVVLTRTLRRTRWVAIWDQFLI